MERDKMQELAEEKFGRDCYRKSMTTMDCARQGKRIHEGNRGGLREEANTAFSRK